MQKKSKRLIIALLVVIALAAWGITFRLGNVVKTAVETMGPRMTGGAVTLQTAVIRPFAGKINLEELTVSNPEGFNTPSAIKLRQLVVNLEITSVMSDTIHIREIVIDGPQITLEQPLTGKSNFKTILDNIEKAMPPTDPTKPKPDNKGKDVPEAKKVIIDSLVIRNGRINLSTPLMQGVAAPIPLPTITLKDVGKEREVGITESVAIIINAILNGAFSAATSTVGALGDGAKLVGDEALKGAIKAIGIAGETATGGANATAEGLKKLGSGASKLTSGLSGMIPGGTSETPAPKTADQPGN